MSIDRPTPEFEHQPSLHPSERIAAERKDDIARIEQIDVPEQAAAQLIFVLVGEQPAMNLSFSLTDDSIDAAAETLRAAGLAVVKEPMMKKWPAAALYVARDLATAESLRAICNLDEGDASYDEEYGRMMGFPETAIDAFVGRAPRLARDEHPSDVDDPSLVTHFIHSKDHWKEEMEVLRRRRDLIRTYAPELYAKIVRPSSSVAEQEGVR